jgi:hypothetical protein
MRRIISLACRPGSRYSILAVLLATVYSTSSSHVAGALPRISDIGLQAKATTPSPRGTTADPSISKTQGRIPVSESVAKPATVTLKNETLTVEASNSDLNQILKNVADLSGMIIDGSVKSARVYGVYGPGNPSEVLSSLLVGSGYNFIMVGLSADGAPRKLLLTVQNGDSTTSPTPTPTQTGPDHRESEDAGLAEDHLGPGAVEHNPPSPSQNPEERMQKNLRRLEQIRDQPKPQ